MPMPHYDDDRERPSWRDIDKMKDKSSAKSSMDKISSKKLHSSYLGKKYKRMLDDMFSGEKKRPREQQNKLQEILDAVATPKFKELVMAYIESYGMPDEWDVLIEMITLRDKELLCHTIDSLMALTPEQSPAKKDILKSKLRTLANTTRHAQVEKKAKEAVERL
jgi:hypothetical protein